jgi:F-type H+-transporting ATPase subunit delta
MNSKVDNRYSLALFNAAEELKCTDAIAVDAQNLIGLLKSEYDLRIFFASPVIKKEKKIKIIESFFKNKLNNLSIDFIKLLILRNREGMIVNILKAFLSLKDDREGIIGVDIKSAVKLDSKLADKFKSKIDDFTNLDSRLNLMVDENLIGGFTIQFKDIMIDASLKRQLEIVRNRFKEQSL